MSKEKNNFEVLNRLAQENKLVMSTTFVEGHTDKKGGVIGMGVDKDTFDQAMQQPEGYYFFLIIADKPRYDALAEE